MAGEERTIRAIKEVRLVASLWHLFEINVNIKMLVSLSKDAAGMTGQRGMPVFEALYYMR